MEFQWESTAIGFAVAGYIMFLYTAIRDLAPFNMVGWSLMGTLNLVLLINLFLSGGNYFVLTVYTGGTFAVSFVLLLKRKFKWTTVESFISLLTIVCMMVWIALGVNAAVIFGVTAVACATVPQIIDSWKNPALPAVPLWLIFFCCNFCFFKVSKDWSISQVGYPLVGLVASAALVVINSLKPKGGIDE